MTTPSRFAHFDELWRTVIALPTAGGTIVILLARPYLLRHCSIIRQGPRRFVAARSVLRRPAQVRKVDPLSDGCALQRRTQDEGPRHHAVSSRSIAAACLRPTGDSF